MTYPTEDNIANPCIKNSRCGWKSKSIYINAEKLTRSSAFPGYFLGLLFIKMLKNKYNFLRMIQNQMSVDVKFICRILVLL